jgi:hypothetical protein
MDIYVGVMDASDVAKQVVEALNRPPDPEPVEEPEIPMAEELRMVLNRHSLENGSNTPDYVLVTYLLSCLAAFNRGTQERDKWYDIKPEPGWDKGGTS